MIELLSKLRYVFEPEDRRYIAGLFGITLVGSFLELISIGAILPLIIMLDQPDVVETHPQLRALYDWVQPSSFASFMTWICLAIVGLYLLKNSYLFLQAYLRAHYTSRKVVSLSRRLFHAYLHSAYDFHLRRNSARLLRNLTIIATVMQAVVLPILVIVTEGIMAVSIMALLLIKDPTSTIVVVTFIGGLLYLYSRVIKQRLYQHGETLRLHSGKVIQEVNQGLGGIKETIILGRESFFERAYEEHLAHTADSMRHQSVVSQSPRFYVETVVVTVIMVLTVFWLMSDSNGTSSVLPLLTMFALAAARLMPSLTRVNSCLSSIRFYTASFNEVYADLVALEQDNFALRETESADVLKLRGVLELRRVSYRYHGEKRNALEGVSLSIKKGQSVGIVGASGAGKTTLVDVLLGLLVPQAGQVLVDEIDIHPRARSWQRSIGYIPQEIFLSDATIRENVAFGVDAEDIDDGLVREALELAQLDEYVASLPNGEHTMVGERGTRLSGGQRQRVGIARALYSQPEVMIMDEATASLDTETEMAFMDSVNRLAPSKTVIMIAHRLSTVKNCDQIYFLTEGTLSASGAYDDLLETSRAFRQMAGE